MCTSDGSRFISLLPAALKSVATLSFTARLSGSPIHLDDVTFNSHPVFYKWLEWVLLDFLMQWLEGLIVLRIPYVDGGKIVALKMGRMYLFLLY